MVVVDREAGARVVNLLRNQVGGNGEGKADSSIIKVAAGSAMQLRYRRARALFAASAAELRTMGFSEDLLRTLTPEDLNKYPVSTYGMDGATAKEDIKEKELKRADTRPTSPASPVLSLKELRNVDLEGRGDGGDPKKAAAQLALPVASLDRPGRPSVSSMVSRASKSNHPVCAVCLDPFITGVSRVRTLPCNHCPTRSFLVARPIPELEAARERSAEALAEAVDSFILRGERPVDIWSMVAECTHMNAPLEISDIEDIGGCPVVVCCMHGYTFDLASGECSVGDEKEEELRAKTFRTKIENTSTGNEAEGAKLEPWVGRNGHCKSKLWNKMALRDVLGTDYVGYGLASASSVLASSTRSKEHPIPPPIQTLVFESVLAAVRPAPCVSPTTPTAAVPHTPLVLASSDLCKFITALHALLPQTPPGPVASPADDTAILVGAERDPFVTVVADALWSVDVVYAQEQGLERERLVEVVVALSNMIPPLPSVLQLRLDPDTLYRSSLLATLPLSWLKRAARVNTNATLRQQRFNLLREESEGWSRLISDLASAAITPTEIAEAVPSTSPIPASELTKRIIDRRATTAVRRMMSLVGYFDLDPSRVLDIIVDGLVAGVKEHSSFWIEVIKKSPWAKKHGKGGAWGEDQEKAKILGGEMDVDGEADNPDDPSGPNTPPSTSDPTAKESEEGVTAISLLAQIIGF
ncbi:THO complex subunit 2, partial [Gonapodya sp. JEL0774]